MSTTAQAIEAATEALSKDWVVDSTGVYVRADHLRALLQARDVTPFSEDMRADGLRAAYENYHALRHQMVVAIDKVKILNGRIAEAAGKVVEAGGQI